MVLSCAIKQVIPTDSSQRQSRHIHTNCRMWWERYARWKIQCKLPPKTKAILPP